MWNKLYFSMNLNPLPWQRGCLVRSELDQWTANGIIQPDQRQRIDNQYDRDCCGIAATDWAKTTFFALAAVSILLALVLVIADHWREIYLPFKLAVSLILMSLAHGLGYWYRFQVKETQRGDIWFFTGTVLYGCVLFVAIDQYYLGSPYRSIMLATAFFAWAAGTLPLAW